MYVCLGDTSSKPAHIQLIHGSVKRRNIGTYELNSFVIQVTLSSLEGNCVCGDLCFLGIGFFITCKVDSLLFTISSKVWSAALHSSFTSLCNDMAMDGIRPIEFYSA
jgi:hypothetical protein